MQFDFPLFQGFASIAYRNVGSSPYSFDDVLRVFKCYFAYYEAWMNKPHPPIRIEQIERIISVMPYIDREDIGAYSADIDPGDYKTIIERHFQTAYKPRCDYNINHFFSGNIRLLRYYEELY